MIRRNPGVGLVLLVEEITRVLDAPWLPSGHPGALEQVREKIEAQAALDQLRRDLSALTRICPKELEKLLDGVGDERSDASLLLQFHSPSLPRWSRDDGRPRRALRALGI